MENIPATPEVPKTRLAFVISLRTYWGETLLPEIQLVKDIGQVMGTFGGTPYLIDRLSAFSMTWTIINASQDTLYIEMSISYVAYITNHIT